ncbi:hypothetical protein HA402_013093 [Bradysia odoriphaga]|nr:hypothetical protein HA402_013093 [Bradysia odoriphaga]
MKLRELAVSIFCLACLAEQGSTARFDNDQDDVFGNEYRLLTIKKHTAHPEVTFHQIGEHIIRNAEPSDNIEHGLDLSGQDGLVTIDLNAFPQFIDLQTKTVLTAKSSEPDDIEQKEFQWLKRIDSFARNTLFNDDAFTLFFKTPSEDSQPHVDIHNLTQQIRDKSIILGNLDLSNNAIISIKAEKNH